MANIILCIFHASTLYCILLLQIVPFRKYELQSPWQQRGQKLTGESMPTDCMFSILPGASCRSKVMPSILKATWGVVDWRAMFAFSPQCFHKSKMQFPLISSGDNLLVIYPNLPQLSLPCRPSYVCACSCLCDWAWTCRSSHTCLTRSAERYACVYRTTAWHYITDNR